jgi:uncharacterized protein (TIGR02145 family)
MKKKILFFFSLPLFLAIIISCEKDNKPPICEITSPSDGAEFYIGDLITLSVEAGDPDGNIFEVRFYIDEIGVSSSNTFPYQYVWNTEGEGLGTHAIRVLAKDFDGGSASDEIAIVFKPAPKPPDAQFIATNTVIYFIGDTVQFIDQSTDNPQTWSWEFGDGTSSSQQNPTHQYSSKGIFTVKLTVTNNNGSDSLIKSDYISITGNKIGTVNDIEGNVYKTVRVGTQTWMAENLRTGHYANGAALTLVAGGSNWDALPDNSLAYCWYYDDSASYANNYGALYTWPAAMNEVASSSSNPSGIQGVCPTGWHLPSDDEWKILEMYLGISQVDADQNGLRGISEGDKLKEAGTNHWTSPNTGATNETDFTAIGSGYRGWTGHFDPIGNGGFWWSSTESSTSNAIYRSLYYNSSLIGRNNLTKKMAFSVRCVKD